MAAPVTIPINLDRMMLVLLSCASALRHVRGCARFWS